MDVSSHGGWGRLGRDFGLDTVTTGAVAKIGKNSVHKKAHR
jgi:hypothetical protein